MEDDKTPPPPPQPELAGEKRKREEDSPDAATEDAPPAPAPAGAGEDAASSGVARHPMWKTSLCSYFRRRGAGAEGCSHGESCRYAHTEEELRPRPDGTLDPTSDRAKKLRKVTAEAQEEAEEEVTVDEQSLDKCLVGLPRGWAADRLKGFLQEQGISYATAKKKKGMTVGFVTFESVEQLTNAVQVLKENPSGGKEIKIADANRRSHQKVHAEGPASDNGTATENGSSPPAGEPSAPEAVASSKKSARDAVTPLAHMPYNDQLEHKRHSMAQILKRLTRNARKACPPAIPLPDWIFKSKEIVKPAQSDAARDAAPVSGDEPILPKPASESQEAKFVGYGPIADLLRERGFQPPGDVPMVTPTEFETRVKSMDLDALSISSLSGSIQSMMSMQELFARLPLRLNDVESERAELEILRKERESLLQVKKSLENEREQLRAERNSASSELDSLKDRVASLEKTRALNTDTIEGLRTQLVEVANLEHKLKDEMKALVAEKEKVVSDAEKHKRELLASIDFKNSLVSEANQLRSQIEQLKAGKDNLDSELLNYSLGIYTEYEAALKQCGAEPLPFPSEDFSVGKLFEWLDDEFKSLPDIFSKVGDYAARTCITNAFKLLADDGCSHYKSFLKKEFKFSSALNPDNKELFSSHVLAACGVFLRRFWSETGRECARSTAYDRLVKHKEALALEQQRQAETEAVACASRASTSGANTEAGHDGAEAEDPKV